ncbi:MAG: HAD family hydrolase [Propionibacteriaceae bacterium]|nr:HAD family hydrolase [Propionibacteriaceae bacterium]MDO5066861.1 HAD family hydrolase [Propionibacteriaceae bacterium]
MSASETTGRPSAKRWDHGQQTIGIGCSQADSHRFPRALLLDLDGTLLDHARASAQAIQQVLADHGLSPVEDAVPLWQSLEAAHFQRYLDGELTFEEQRIARATAFLTAHGAVAPSRSTALSWFDDYLTHYEASWSPFEDVQPFLASLTELAAPPLTAVLTNGDHAQQRAKLDAMGLGSMPLHASSTLGVRKPDPRTFLRVCADLGVTPERAWYVGDNFEVDALGAESAGLHGIWLNRSATTSRRGHPSHAADLTTVAAWLSEISPGRCRQL